MDMIKDEDRKHLEEHFKGLENEVRIVYFTQKHECHFCQTNRELLEDVAGLSVKIKLEVKDFLADKKLAAELGIDKIPATAVLGDEDYKIRFFGIPAGYEFTTLIETILMVSRRSSGLAKEVLDELARVKQPVHLQVLVSPTCPYCPTAVLAAFKLAMKSKYVRSDMVEVSEFPYFPNKYNMKGVPHTVINEDSSAIGALPEKELLEKIMEAIG